MLYHWKNCFIFNSAFIVTPPRPMHSWVINRKKIKEIVFSQFAYYWRALTFKGALTNGIFSGPRQLCLLSVSGAYYWKCLLSELCILTSWYKGFIDTKINKKMHAEILLRFCWDFVEILLRFAGKFADYKSMLLLQSWATEIAKTCSQVILPSLQQKSLQLYYQHM